MAEVKTPNFLVFDFETGGLDNKVNAVTEFAGIAISGQTFEEMGRYEAILAPYDDELLYEPDALKVTGITMEMVNKGIDFKTFTREFTSFLKKTNTYTHQKYRTVLVGHNVQFDIGFLQQLFYKMGKKIQDYISCDEDFYGNQQPNYFDTQKLAMVKWGNDETMLKHTLSACAEKIGIEIVNAHRAMNDVVATKDIVVNFFKSLRNEGHTGPLDTIITETRFRDTFKF